METIIRYRVSGHSTLDSCLPSLWRIRKGILGWIVTFFVFSFRRNVLLNF
jgi:hypothetical protein